MPKIPDIKKVAAVSLGAIDSVLNHWLPGGKREGAEYLPLNPLRGDSKPGSFSVNLKTGKWSDFATGDKGLDLVSLVAYLENCSQGQAAEKLAAFLNISLDKKSTTPERATGKPKEMGKAKPSPGKGDSSRGGSGDSWVCVMPVPNDAPKPPIAHSRHGKPTRRHTYTTPDGQVNFYHDRHEKKGGERKQFAPLSLWRKDDRFEWRFKAPPEPRPLYGLPGLVAFPDAKVWFVEGEKAAEALHKLLPKQPVLCWQGGSQAVAKSDYSPLDGRDCVVFPDNDLPGKKAGNDLARRLKAAGAGSVHLVDVDQLALVPGWEGKGNTKTATLADGEPLAVGDDAADLVECGWQAEHFELFLKRDGVFVDAESLIKESKQSEKTRSNKSSDGETIERFQLLEKGLYCCEQMKDGTSRIRWVCPPIEPLAMVRTERGIGWGWLVRLVDPDGREKKIVLNMRAFNGDSSQAIGDLLDAGLSIASSARKLVVEYLQASKPKERVITTNRTGWHGEDDKMAFVLPDEYIGTTKEDWLFTQSSGFNQYRQRGTLKQWQEKVASLCAGNSRLAFALSAAFASPLIYLAGAESGGFHFVGNSSYGKTTALHAASSVYGGKDFMLKWRATCNGIEGAAESRCDALLALDEIKQVPPREAIEAAYMLANGSAKLRLQKTGGLRDTATWRLFFLSSGEKTLKQYAAEAGLRVDAGAEIRLASIAADAGMGMGAFENIHGFDSSRMFSEALVANAAKYYGVAFIEYIKCVLAKREGIRPILEDCEVAFSKATLTDKASGQAGRVASRFALVAAGGELATEWGITGWKQGEAMQAAITCFKAWLDGYGGESNQEERQMLKQVRHFLELHSEGRFVDRKRSVVNDSHAPKVLSKAGFREHSEEGDQITTDFYILTEVFKEEVCKGFDYRQVARLLIDKGFMRADGEHLQPKVTLPGEGQRRVFHVLSTIWNDEND